MTSNDWYWWDLWLYCNMLGVIYNAFDMHTISISSISIANLAKWWQNNRRCSERFLLYIFIRYCLRHFGFSHLLLIIYKFHALRHNSCVFSFSMVLLFIEHTVFRWISDIALLQGIFSFNLSLLRLCKHLRCFGASDILKMFTAATWIRYPTML